MLTFRTARHHTGTSGETWSTAYLKIPRSHPWFHKSYEELQKIAPAEITLDEPTGSHRTLGFITGLRPTNSDAADQLFNALDAKIRAMHALGNTLPLSGEVTLPPAQIVRSIIEPYTTEDAVLAKLDMQKFGEFWLMQGDSQLAVVHWSTGPAFSTGVHVHPTRQDALNFITTLL